MSTTKTASQTMTAADYYLSWWNDFRDLSAFAAHYGLTEETARQLIGIGCLEAWLPVRQPPPQANEPATTREAAEGREE